MRKRHCRICRNLNDGTRKLLNFNRILAQASLSLEDLAESISHYVVRRRKKVRGEFKWVESDPPRRARYSAIEVKLHRDQCMNGVVEKGLELVCVPKPGETAVDRADRLYLANERVFTVIVDHILKKSAQGKQLDEHELSLIDRFNQNMMKINQFRAKVNAETKPAQSNGQPNPGDPQAPGVSVTINQGLQLPTTYGKSEDEVKRMIDVGMAPAGLAPAQVVDVQTQPVQSPYKKEVN